MIQFHKPIVFIDLETTGTDVSKDKIIELAVTKWNPADNSRESKCYRFNPGIPIPPKTTEVHGIKDEDVANEPIFKLRVPALLKYLEDCDIAGFNSNNYDIPLLLTEITNAGYSWDVSQHKFFDASVIFKRMEERTLSAAVRFYLNREHEGAHGAAADTEATLDVFLAQLNKYFSDKEMPLEEFETYCNYDKKRLDFAGMFVYNDQGQIVYGKGKYKDKPYSTDYQYLYWIFAQSNFAPDTKAIAKEFYQNSSYK